MNPSQVRANQAQGFAAGSWGESSTPSSAPLHGDVVVLEHWAQSPPAARVYAKIAPAASHALHMPAHAFLQAGFWDEAAASDEASWITGESLVIAGGLR